MKNFVTMTILSLLTSQAFAATVVSTRLDAKQENILIDVVYGGGCGEHKFSLSVGACMESEPAQCPADLIHETNDSCRMLIRKTVVFPLVDLGFSDVYYRGASLTIFGDESSAATLQLP